MTAPAPQSLDILRNSKIQYPAKLDQISYAKSLVGLFQVKLENENQKSAYVNPGSAIFSIADNQTKGMCSSSAWSVVMNSEWSHSHFDKSDEAIIDAIALELIHHYSGKIIIEKAQLKKWKFSHPLSKSTEKFFALNDGKIILAGDGFTSGSLRGAVDSSQAVADYLKLRLNKKMPIYLNGGD